MEEIQCIKDGNHHLWYLTHACAKKTSCDSNPSSLLKFNQNYSTRNDKETLDMYKCRDEQFSEFSYDSCDPYSVLDFDDTSDGYDHGGLDKPKEFGEQQQQLSYECKTNLQPNLKIFEPIKLSPNSDEFIEEVRRMFAEPTGDLTVLHSFFPHV